ncbi:MAG TPA: kelch repeat-containing protein [Geothrix sp.]|nr:kelch repeat-containing protein [Geothrix sp.]
MTPRQATVRVGGEVQFTAADAQGRPVDVTYRVMEAGGGSVTLSGRYRAPVQAGTYRVQAQTADHRQSGEASVTVAPYQGSLTRLANSQFTHVAHSATLLEDDSVLLVGGPESSVAERFLPATGTFVGAGDMGAKRWSHTADALPGGSVLFTGGIGAGGALGSSTLYANGRFTSVVSRMVQARYAHRAALLPDGRLLLTGGLPFTGSDVTALAACEIYDPAQQTFSPASPMSVPRAGHTATRLPDGRILVVGGQDSTCLFSCPITIWQTAELYDPATGTFQPTGAMSQRRFNHTATLLPDGRVLVAGGTSPDTPDTDVSSLVEIYDPATGLFQAVGHMVRPRSQHTATLLGDGTVLMAGGQTYGENTLASATVEAFDPATGNSRLTSSDATTRYRHAAVRLASGPVLIVGGSEGGAPIFIVERYE